eukprot:COSAG01_NODE_60563_length_294_cov_0.748718_1_plen_74_part_10
MLINPLISHRRRRPTLPLLSCCCVIVIAQPLQQCPRVDRAQRRGRRWGRWRRQLPSPAAAALPSHRRFGAHRRR